MTGSRQERDKFAAAILGGRDRREEIRAEWEALGLEPRIQSPDELRRVLMTWKKDDLVSFLIRAESAEIKANRNRLGAWKEAQEVREHALVLPANGKRFEFGATDPFNAWLAGRIGQTYDARFIFMEGWRARARTEEALSERTDE